MLGNLNGWHLIIILAIVLLLFGAPRLPALARSVGQSMKIFKSEIKDPDAEKKAAAAAAASETTAPAATVADPARTTPADSADTTPKP